jgi:hypothetical protein
MNESYHLKRGPSPKIQGHISNRSSLAIVFMLGCLSIWMPATATDQATFAEYSDPDSELTTVSGVIRSGGLTLSSGRGFPSGLNLFNLAHPETTGSPALYVPKNNSGQTFTHLARDNGGAFDLVSLELAKVYASNSGSSTLVVSAYRDVDKAPVIIQNLSFDSPTRSQSLVLNDMTHINYVRIEVLGESVLIDSIGYQKDDLNPPPSPRVSFHHIYASGYEVDIACHPLILGREYQVESSSDLITWTGYTHTAFRPNVVFGISWPLDSPKHRFFRISWQE